MDGAKLMNPTFPVIPARTGEVYSFGNAFGSH